MASKFYHIVVSIENYILNSPQRGLRMLKKPKSSEKILWYQIKSEIKVAFFCERMLVKLRRAHWKPSLLPPCRLSHSCTCRVHTLLRRPGLCPPRTWHSEHTHSCSSLQINLALQGFCPGPKMGATCETLPREASVVLQQDVTWPERLAQSQCGHVTLCWHTANWSG